MKTKLRPHVVLGSTSKEKDLHALSFTTGDFADIVFSYNDVSFDEKEDEDKLVVKFEYVIHEVPENKAGYDKKVFEKELGDFMIELLYYGLEKDKLGYITDEQNREDDIIELDPQRDVLPEGGTVSKN